MNNKESKRKIKDTSLEDIEEQRAFQRSRIITRSPTKEVETENHMAEILQAINSLKQDMNKGFQDSNKQNDELKTELEKVNKELKQMKEEMKTKEDAWMKEKQEMMKRINKLEENAEKQDKIKRRNNIVIKNIELEEDNIKEQIKAIIYKKLNTKVTINEAFEIKKGIIIAKIENWQQKMAIMKNKPKLKGTEIYIENDLTKNELYIQKELRRIAKEENQKGNSAKVGYQKITINNKIYEWEELNRDNISKN